MKSNLDIKIWIVLPIALLIFIAFTIFENKRLVNNELEKMNLIIAQKDSIIKEQQKTIEQLELDRETLVETLDMREDEVSFWGRLSDLYREGKRKEAEKMRMDSFSQNPFEQ